MMLSSFNDGPRGRFTPRSRSGVIRALELAKLKQAHDDGLTRGQPHTVDAETLLGEFKTKARAHG